MICNICNDYGFVLNRYAIASVITKVNIETYKFLFIICTKDLPYRTKECRTKVTKFLEGDKNFVRRIILSDVKIVVLGDVRIGDIMFRNRFDHCFFTIKKDYRFEFFSIKVSIR